jgi:hypothetical protein
LNAEDKILEWCLDPELFTKEALYVQRISTQQSEGFKELTKLVTAKLKLKSEKQGHEIAYTEEDRKYLKKIGVSIMSGKGTGKDAFASWCIIWFLCCFEDTKVPCTANSGAQLNDVLWKEIGKWLHNSKVEAQKLGLEDSYPNSALVHQAKKLYLKESNGNWFATPRTINVKASAEEQGETLSGLHSESMMVVIDEASGIPDAVFRPLETTLTKPFNFVLMIFNPTRSRGFAIDSHGKYKEHWVTVHWDSRESENVSEQLIEYMRKKFGEDSPGWRAYVQGLPPRESSDTLIPMDWVMNAVDSQIEPEDNAPIIFGVDVARQGVDKSIILKRKGPRVYEIAQFSKIDTMELAGWIALAISEDQPDAVYIDVIGIGYGVYDRLREMGFYNVHSVNVSNSAAKNDTFYRLRDELWWKCRERFEQNLINIPDDDELIGELSGIKYKPEFHSKSVIKIESKDEMKKRDMMSPNKADALCLTFYGNDACFAGADRGAKKYNFNQSNNKPSLGWMAA